MRMICCGRGELCLRSCFWVWWYIGAAIPKLIETFVFVWPAQIIEAILLQQWAETIAGGLLGVFMSYAVFLPLADSSTQIYPSGVCSMYVCVWSWVVGAFVTSFVIDLRVLEPLKHRIFHDTCWCRRVRAGAWLGVAIGLSFALSLTLIVHPLPSQVRAFEDWCRPHPTMPLPLLAVPIGLFGALAHMVDVPSANKVTERFQHVNDQRHSSLTVHHTNTQQRVVSNHRFTSDDYSLGTGYNTPSLHDLDEV